MNLVLIDISKVNNHNKVIPETLSFLPMFIEKNIAPNILQKKFFTKCRYNIIENHYILTQLYKTSKHNQVKSSLQFINKHLILTPLEMHNHQNSTLSHLLFEAKSLLFHFL